MGSPRVARRVRKREQLGPGQTFDHTPRPHPPSCPQSHNELKQQCELLKIPKAQIAMATRFVLQANYASIH